MAEIGHDIDRAAHLLRSGKLVAIPTETVYGLAANAFDPKAVVCIFETKNRPVFDPLIVHCPDIGAAEKLVAGFPSKARKLAEALWPGPLTLVLKKNGIIPDIVTSGNSTVGIRVPSHPDTLSLLQKLDFPLAAPSANPFGYISPTTAQHVNAQLGDKIEYILDGGPSNVGIESTIISVSEEDEATLLRLGGIGIERISEIVGAVDFRISTHSNPEAPGQLDSHYSPRIPLKHGEIAKLLIELTDLNEVGIIAFSVPVAGVSKENQRVLSPSGNLNEAACNLFRMMRELDEKKLRLIIAEKVPDRGLGQAINDRLHRASEK